MKQLLNYFLQGVVLIAPVAITLYACYFVFVTIDGWLGLGVPGIGFLVTLLLITLVGFLGSGLVTRSLVALLERVMTRVPLVRLLYSSTKDLLNAFVGEKRRFDTPVLVALFPGSSAKAMGFVTQESLTALGLPGHVAVYFPQSYNFAGNLLVVPSEHVTRLAADSAHVMAFIVSGGVTQLERGDDVTRAKPGTGG